MTSEEWDDLMDAAAEAAKNRRDDAEAVRFLPENALDEPIAEALEVRTVSVVRARLVWHVLERAGRLKGLDDDFRGRAFRDLISTVEALHRAEAQGSVCVTPKRFAAVAKGRTGLTQAVGRLERIGVCSRCDAEGKTTGERLFIAERDETGERVLRLYSARSFYEELALAEIVSTLTKDAEAVPVPDDPEALRDRAVAVACRNALSVISGGPGTGKTSAVTAILRQILRDKAESRIVMAAPTGKAAGRMQEAVRRSVSTALTKDEGDEAAAEVLRALEGRTIHRLLSTVNADGVLPGPDAPIDADVLVVDESSMIDAKLAVRLFRAIDVKRTKVILLGDRFQLAAVGPGSVFADLSDETGVLGPVITRLTHSYRFEDGKAVASLAAAVNEGRTDADFGRLANTGNRRDDNVIRLHGETVAGKDMLTPALKETVKRAVKMLEDAVARSEGLDRTERAARAAALWADFGILCAQRRGPMSVEAVNQYADGLMQEVCDGLGWRPVIVRKNDPLIGVSNGDVGIVLPDENGEGEDLYLPNGAEGGRLIKLALVEAWELAFAITIHQSQGSEYLHVAVVLPAQEDSQLATRELLYTGVTRVKDAGEGKDKVFGTLDIFGTEAVLKRCAAESADREGGLAARLAQLRAAE